MVARRGRFKQPKSLFLLALDRIPWFGHESRCDAGYSAHSSD